MPCWVVPAVASEIWNVTVDQILAAVRAGQIPSKHENGFTFIDVAPGAPAASFVPKPRPAPVAYRVPRNSGAGDPIPLPRPAEAITPGEPRPIGEPEATGESPDEETDAAMGDWRKGRQKAAARRVPPT